MGSAVGTGVAVGSAVGTGVAVGSAVGTGVAVGSAVGTGVAVGSGSVSTRAMASRFITGAWSPPPSTALMVTVASSSSTRRPVWMLSRLPALMVNGSLMVTLWAWPSLSVQVATTFMVRVMFHHSW